MRRIDGDWREQEVELSFAVILDKCTSSLVQFMQTKNADTFLRKLWTQFFVPALVLLSHEVVQFLGDQVPLFEEREPVRTGFGVTIFDLLNQARDPHLEEFVQVRSEERRVGKDCRDRCLQVW